MNDFGPTLDFFCKKQGITLKALANQLGISRNTITNWKANGRPPSREDTKNLAKLLYLNEEEADILLHSAQYAPEHLSREAKETYFPLKHFVSSDNKPNYQGDFIEHPGSFPLLQDIKSDHTGKDAFHRKISNPFMVEDLPYDFVHRPNEFESLIEKLLNKDFKESIAVTTALRGSGGYGKTTLAKALCHDTRIKEAFHDGILWVTLGQSPSNLVGKIEDLIYILSRERPGFISIDAASAYLAELFADKDILLVIDDVWDAIHLRPFLQGGKHCIRLITTRDDRVLPPNTYRIHVDAMRRDEALILLSAGILEAENLIYELSRLSARLGEWALLLKLVNAMLRERIRRGESLVNALVYVNKLLDKRHLTIFDNENTQDRNQAVEKTLSGSFELLSIDQYARYRELAIFSEDIDIPLTTVQMLWNSTGALDDIDTESLCKLLHDLSLLLHFDLAKRTIRLHDVIRTYLQQEVGNQVLVELHTQLLDAYGYTNWADLPHDEPYLWDHLADHLVNAQRGNELVATVKDGNYIATKIYICKAYSFEVDLCCAEKQAPTDKTLSLLKHNVICMGHLLNRCQTLNEVRCNLYGRLLHLENLFDVWGKLEQKLAKPFLLPWYSLPDLPHTALLRTLTAHRGEVTSCDISPNGDFIVSASLDDTLKVWDTQTWSERLTLYGHKAIVSSCAVSPTGKFIISASLDRTLRVWDAHTGIDEFILQGHTEWVHSCTISPNGDFIVSASFDGTLKVWDTQTWTERLTLYGHQGWVLDCAISPKSDFIISVSYDHTLKVWDTYTGDCLATLYMECKLRTCAIHPDGEHIVAGGGGEVYFLRLAR